MGIFFNRENLFGAGEKPLPKVTLDPVMSLFFPCKHIFAHTVTLFSLHFLACVLLLRRPSTCLLSAYNQHLVYVLFWILHAP